MVPRGSGRRVALVVVVAGFVVVAATLLAYRRPTPPAGPANPATSTLTVALPGPFNGCSVLNPGATATTSAILDLIRPSAFQTGPTNVLTGEGGAIVSAELISLHPETVTYSIDPKMSWSNGRPFSVSDLITWWHEARQWASVNGDGYRAISSMAISKSGNSVTATFSTDFADWDLLFRDVEQAGAARSCAVGELATTPSLGPYLVESASPTKIVLLANPEWTINYNRFHEVILTTSTTLPDNGANYFVTYQPVATKSLVETLVAHPRFQGQFGDSSDVVEMTFSPHRALTAQRPTRVALSWLLNRRAILDHLFGSFTFTPSVPTSALFSQGQAEYPPVDKSIVATAHNFGVVDPSLDCVACARTLLATLGWVRTPGGWRDASGAMLHLVVGVGPSLLDHQTAFLVKEQWRVQGVAVTLREAGRDEQAASWAASGAVDAAIFDRPTSTTPWVSARSWGQTPYADSYPSGVRTAPTNRLFKRAQTTFNPATAALSWLKIDHLILSDFWVRPLYTVPSLTEWSGPVANVLPSLSLSGLVDQVSNWGISLTTTTTRKSVTSPVG